MRNLTLALALLFWVPAFADVSAMVGLGKGALEHESFERAGFIGYQFNIGESFFVKPKIGGWLGGDGSPSWLVSVPVGLMVWTPSGIYAHAGVGPARISAPDDILGGHFQFDTEIGVGIKSKDASIELSLWHISSGGIYKQNQGRDIIGISVGIVL